MDIRIILSSTNDPLYEAERQLRNRILLRPIGIPDYGWEMHDDKALHFLAVQQDQVVGCVLLVPLNARKNKVQLIQMAVDTGFQGKGIGKRLMQHLLQFCKSREIQEIEIHAREPVVSFYEQFGFKVYGAPFEEVGIQHRFMQKKL